MSVRVMSDVWALDLPATDKMVLLALADAANDDGVTWIALRSRRADKLDLLHKCSLSERAIQGAIKRLCDLELLSRLERPGRGVIYTVTPAGDAPRSKCPPQETTVTPAGDAGKPSSNRKNGGSNEPPTGRNAGKHLLPKDWKLPAIADLPLRARTCAEQWTESSYETHGEAFICYWRARRGMWTDWNDVWANRIVALHSQVMRDQKFGNAPKSPEELKQAVAMSAGWSDAEKAEFREICELRETASFDEWFRRKEDFFARMKHGTARDRATGPPGQSVGAAALRVVGGLNG